MRKNKTTTKEKPAHPPQGLIILQCEECGAPFKKEDVDEYIECRNCGHTYYNPNWAKEKDTIVERVVDTPRTAYIPPISVTVCTTSAVGYYSSDMSMPYALDTGVRYCTSDDIR